MYEYLVGSRPHENKNKCQLACILEIKAENRMKAEATFKIQEQENTVIWEHFTSDVEHRAKDQGNSVTCSVPLASPMAKKTCLFLPGKMKRNKPKEDQHELTMVRKSLQPWRSPTYFMHHSSHTGNLFAGTRKFTFLNSTLRVSNMYRRVTRGYSVPLLPMGLWWSPAKDYRWMVMCLLYCVCYQLEAHIFRLKPARQAEQSWTERQL